MLTRFDTNAFSLETKDLFIYVFSFFLSQQSFDRAKKVDLHIYIDFLNEDVSESDRERERERERIFQIEN